MKYLSNVAYLEDSDFDSAGNLINPVIPNNIPVVIMIQALFCPHCTTSKPAFQEFADQTRGKVFCATIEGDGKRPGEVKLSQHLTKILPSFRGFPDYALFNDGKRVTKTISGRGVEHLHQFIK